MKDVREKNGRFCHLAFLFNRYYNDTCLSFLMIGFRVQNGEMAK